MAQKAEPTIPVAVSLITTMLTASVSVSLSLLNVEAEKSKAITTAIAACTPQELPTVMSMLGSFQQARIAEIALMDWDRQRKEDEQRRLSSGLATIKSILH